MDTKAYQKGDKVWVKTLKDGVEGLARDAAGAVITYEITRVINLRSGDHYVLTTGGQEVNCHCGRIGYPSGCLVPALPDDDWHTTGYPCLHCSEGRTSGHYLCSEDFPCEDCVDSFLTAAEDIDAGYGPHGEDTGGDVERDTDLEHPWNMNA